MPETKSPHYTPAQLACQNIARSIVAPMRIAYNDGDIVSGALIAEVQTTVAKTLEQVHYGLHPLLPRDGLD